MSIFLDWDDEPSSLSFYPYIEDGDLIIDATLDGNECAPVRLKLAQLFQDFIDYRKERFSSAIGSSFREEVAELVAELRTIAREMEVELNGTRI